MERDAKQRKSVPAHCDRIGKVLAHKLIKVGSIICKKSVFNGDNMPEDKYRNDDAADPLQEIGDITDVKLIFFQPELTRKNDIHTVDNMKQKRNGQD